MIKSMTAYAGASYMESGIQCDVEMRTYNSKHLDIALYMHRSFNRFEERIKQSISEKLARGRIEVRIDIQERTEDDALFDLDLPRAESYYNALKRLQDHFGLSSDISLETLLGARDIIVPSEKKTDDALIESTLSQALDTALDQLELMRSREGENLAADLMDRLATIENTLDLVEVDASGLPVLYRERLMERISALTSGMDGLDPVRLAQEAAILADRSDISEEIVRARSHCTLFREAMESDEPVGKKLNFLIQEFNREFNTMGSKAGRAALSHKIVDLKSELEKIREQVQNIE